MSDPAYPERADDPISYARELLAAADPQATYRSMAALARTNNESVLQPLPYSSALPYHNPTCVVVPPDPSGYDTPHVYARATYRDFDRVLVAPFTSKQSAHLLTEIHHPLTVDVSE